jgi:hypothetical protein
MLLTICCAVRAGGVTLTSALSVQSLSLSAFLFKKFSQTRKKKNCEHLRSLVLEDQDSLVLDDKLDVWPGGAAGGLPDAEKLGDGDVEAGQQALLDDEVDVVDEVKRPSALDVALGGEAVAGLRFDGIELDLQRVLESRGLQAILKGVCGEGDDGLWRAGDAGGMPAGADGLVGASSCTTDCWEVEGDGLGSGWHCVGVCLSGRSKMGSFTRAKGLIRIL